MKRTAFLALLMGGSSYGQGIFDSATGLQWLSLTNTVGIPESQVQSLWPTYTIASQAQVIELWADSGLFQRMYTTNNWHPVDKFMSAMGVTSWQDQYPQSFGAVAGGSVAAIDFLYSNGVPEYAVYCGSLWHSPDYAFPTTGTYMFQTVPEPGVLGLGLIALLTMNYRKP